MNQSQNLTSNAELLRRALQERIVIIDGALIEVDRVNFQPAELDWKIRTDSDGRFSWTGALLRALPYLIDAPGFFPRRIPFRCER